MQAINYQRQPMTTLVLTRLNGKDAVAHAFPLGGMTESGLRREARAGRLAIEKIANKDFTTLRDIEEMRKLYRVKAEGRACGGAGNGATMAGLSRGERGLLSTVVSISPRDALQAKIDKRRSA